MKTLSSFHRRTLRAVAIATFALIATVPAVLGNASFVNGFVPDWLQPYAYNAPNGPGPDPVAGVANQWNAWCAPTSAANLAGHWQDFWGVPVADGLAFPASPGWPAVNWHDYEADANRPAPRAPGLGGPPYVQTDIGWFMDTNRGILYDLGGGVMGGDDYANAPHTGTFLKDIDKGLLTFLNVVSPTWTTGTQGKGFFSGLQADGVTPAAFHLNEPSAFGEVVSEINKGHTLILCYTHWNLIPVPVFLPSVPAGTELREGDFGGQDFKWATSAGTPFDDSTWNGDEGPTSLGHAVTAVGYIPAGDPQDQWQAAGLAGPTNWVVVHDNWGNTPRNVVVPYNFNGTWVANTNAVPEPGTFLMLASGIAMLFAIQRHRRHS